MFSKAMTAPTAAGTAREDWKLVNGSGTTINIGALSTLFVSINVTIAVADGATFVSETIPEGTSYLAGTAFTKTWTIRNTGTTIWNSGYKFRFVSGATMSDHLDIPISGTVAPNASFMFSKAMTAPTAAGTAHEDWKLVNGSGTTINIGALILLW